MKTYNQGNNGAIRTGKLVCNKHPDGVMEKENPARNILLLRAFEKVCKFSIILRCLHHHLSQIGIYECSNKAEGCNDLQLQFLMQHA